VAVAAQVALLAAQAMLRRRRDWPTPAPVRVVACALGACGAAIVAAGSASLGSGLTASPLPNARTELRTDGLYRHVRHPIYTGVIAISCARTLSSGDHRQATLSAALVLLLLGKSHLEERALSSRFNEYPAYAGATPRFIPRGLTR
jgi:protein-S-isoprenylcysteine O-methyltransferase Ste14